MSVLARAGRLLALIACAATASCQAPIGQGKGGKTAEAPCTLHLVRVDVLDRIFPDLPPVPASYSKPIGVPANGRVAFQFAASSDLNCTCSVCLGPIARDDDVSLAGGADIYELVPVPVEANNNGGSRTKVGVRPPEEWMRAFVREAPFEVAEVLRKGDALALTAGRRSAILVDVHVAPEAKPGIYTGQVTVRHGACYASKSFSLEVYSVRVPDEYPLHTTYWLSARPCDLCSNYTPDWWSNEHWALLHCAGRTLREFGQDHIYTPILDGRHPLIRTVLCEDGAYRFDYTRFDRWAELFFGLGFRVLEGHHVGGGHRIAVPPMAHLGGVWVLEEATGRQRLLFPRPATVEQWLEFLPVFYRSLYAHLKEKGWVDSYVQCQLDEPAKPEEYVKLAEIARKHMPGVRTKDAINSRPEQFSPLVDIQVFSLISLLRRQDLAAERRRQGQSVWLYHCCSPYPPHPNRHLDERLGDSRLYPWLAFKLGAEGYLYWAANMYRGADPYKTSIGPLPNGSQKPGHPPGDNWFFYPTGWQAFGVTRQGLVGSMRMVAFRAGLLDHSLLVMLAERDPDRANEIMQSIVGSVTDYETEYSAYHEARRSLLDALTKTPHGGSE